jgi:hypothetical protein
VAASFDDVNKVMTIQLDCNPAKSVPYTGAFIPSSLGFIRIASCSVNPPSRFVNGAIDAVIIKGWK